MPDSIPVRFNAAAVARYETVIRQLCASWPEPILVNPAPLSVETFRCRFRDAMRGVLEFNQGPDELAKLLSALSEPVVLSELSGMLRIGPKSARHNGTQRPLQAGMLISGKATLAEESEALVGPDKAAIEAIALLCGMGILSGAKVSGVSEKFIWDCFPQDYEGGVMDNEDGTFSIY